MENNVTNNVTNNLETNLENAVDAKRNSTKQVKNIASSIRQSMIIASIILVTFFTVVQASIEYRIDSRKLESRIAEMERTSRQLVAIALWNFNDDTLKIIGDQLLSNGEVLKVSIWDELDRLHYVNMKDLDRSYTVERTSIIQGQRDKAKVLGRMKVVYTEKPLLENLAQTFFSILLFNFIKISVLDYIIMNLLNRLVIRPLNKLGKTILLLPEDQRIEESLSPRSMMAARVGLENEIGTVARFIAHREQRLQQLISDLQIRETTLRESESHQRDLAERLQFLMQANQLGSWEIDLLDGSAVYNDRWGEILGISAEKISPYFCFWTDRIHSDDQHRFKEEWNALIKGEVSSIKNIHRIQHESQQWIWVLCTGTAVYRDATDRSSRMVGTNLDISDLVNAREEALAANKSKSEFLANMSHEIRTPLNGVLGMTSLLKRTKLDATQLEFIKTIDISGKQLLSVISDILDISKVEAGKFDLSPVPTHIRNVVENVVRILSPVASNKGLSVTFEIADNVPDVVYCDDTRLQQVLVNLTGNAAKFTSFGGVKIVVSARPSPTHIDREEIEFHVIDNGIGIPEESLKNMFQPFSQADATVTRKFGGTGLGLAISKQIVGLMNGEISVTSVVNSGSDFKFTIHVHAVADADLSPLDEVKVVNENLKIMIAEDNLISQKVLFKMIRAQGFQASLAINGIEAVHQALTQQHHIIFMDLVMPEMDGIEACKRILTQAKSAGLPPPTIIAITPSTSPDVASKLTEIGFSGSYEKPISNAQVRQVISSKQQELMAAATKAAS